MAAAGAAVAVAAVAAGGRAPCLDRHAGVAVAGGRAVAAVVVAADAAVAAARGRVAPGVYKVTMTANGKPYTNTITVRPDPMLQGCRRAGAARR